MTRNIATGERSSAVRRQRRLRVRRSGRRTALVLLTNAGVWVIALATLLPLLWIAAPAFRPKEDFFSTDPSLIPDHPTLENFSELLATTQFLHSIANSLLVAVPVAIVGTLIACLGGYAFAFLDFRGRRTLFAIVLLTLTLPPFVTVLPNFVLFAQLGLLNTLLAVILPQLAIPFAIYWMRDYMAQVIDPAMLEAARIDGASDGRVFRSVVFPNVGGGMAAVAIWLFLGAWNNLLLPLTYIQSDNMHTYPLFLATLRGTLGQNTLNLVVAASVLSTIPILVMYFTLQRYFVADQTAGATKG